MIVEVEVELNRAWIYDEEDEEEIGETNFVVPFTWLKTPFDRVYADKYKNLGEFLEVYEPEVDGESIYREAIKDGALIEDLGIVMY